MANNNDDVKQKRLTDVQHDQGDPKSKEQIATNSWKNIKRNKKCNKSQTCDQSSESEDVKNQKYSRSISSNKLKKNINDKNISVKSRRDFGSSVIKTNSKAKDKMKSSECHSDKLNFKQSVILKEKSNTNKFLMRRRKENKILKLINYCPIFDSNLDNENLKNESQKKKKKRIMKNDQSDIYLETSSDSEMSYDRYSVLSTFPPLSLPTDDSSDASWYCSKKTSDDDDDHIVKPDESKISFKFGHVEIKGKFQKSPSIDSKSTRTTRASTIDSSLIDNKEVFITEENKQEKQINELSECEIDESELTEMKYEKVNIVEDDQSFEKNIPYLKDVYGIGLPIAEEYRKKLNFVETLIIVEEILTDEQKAQMELECNRNKITNNEKYSNVVNAEEVLEIGGFRLAIESDACKFITVCTSQFSYKNGIGGNKLIAISDMDLKMIEDKKTEWHLTLHNKIEQILHVFKEKQEHVAYKTKIENGNILDKQRADVVLNTTGNFILDGGLFILMRYLILRKYQGMLTVWSMNILGDLLKCILDVGKPKVFKIGDRICETTRIKKTFISRNFDPIVSKTYFLPSGHIVQHKWKGSKIFLHINPFCPIPPPTSSPYLCNLQKDWQNDIVLFSKYLDLQEDKRSEIESYINENYEFKSILSDFILTAIIEKPDDVLDFAIEYFLNVCDDEED